MSKEAKEIKLAFLYVQNATDSDIETFIKAIDDLDLPFDMVITNKQISFLGIEELKTLTNMFKDIIEKYESKSSN